MNVEEMWRRSNELRNEVEAKGPLKKVYAIHSYVGSVYMLEDADGVFYLDLDGDFRRAEDGYADEASPAGIAFMRSKNVPEETIQRIVKQCQEAKERKGS